MNVELAKAELKPIVDLFRQWNNRHNVKDKDGKYQVSFGLIDTDDELYFNVFANPGETTYFDFTFREELKSPYPDPEVEAPWNGIGGTE